MPLAEIKPSQVAAFVAESRGGASTIARDISVLHAVLDSARREELIDGNPAERVERPRQPRRRWRLLEPHEVTAVSKPFSDVRARRVFLCLALTGLRRSEVVRLRWRDVNLLESKLRVVESKSEEGERLMALSPMLAREFADHFAGTRYRADSDYVFAHPDRGTPLETSRWYPAQFRKALAAAWITDYVRPHHDARHGALTNLAAAGVSGPTLMAIAGHRSYSTTQEYINLAGVTFPDEMAALERRLLGARTDASHAVESSTDLSESQPISGHPTPS